MGISRWIAYHAIAVTGLKHAIAVTDLKHAIAVMGLKYIVCSITVEELIGLSFGFKKKFI